MLIPKTGKGISSRMFYFVLFMTSVIDIETLFPNVICGCNCIPMTFTCHIWDKLQSAEFKNSFLDYYREHPQSKHWQYEEHVYLHYIFWELWIRAGLFLSEVPLAPSQISPPGQEWWALAQSYVTADPLARTHQFTGLPVAVRKWIMAEFGPNGNINLSLSQLLHVMKRVGM